MTEQQDLLPDARVSRVTIGRLHNLGNYEHMRFEVTVDLPVGTSPASVIGDLAQVLNDLEPKPPIPAWRLLQARDLLKTPPPLPPLEVTPDDDEPPFGETSKEAYGREMDRRDEALRTIAMYEAWRKTSEAAMARFDEYGGLRRRTEAKRFDEGDDA